MTKNEDKYEKYLEQIKKKDRKSLILFSLIFISILTLNTAGKISKTINTQNQEIQVREDLLITKDSILETIKNDVKEVYSKIDTTSLDSNALKSFKNVWDNVIKYSEDTSIIIKYNNYKNDDPKIEKILKEMNFYITKKIIDNSNLKVNSIWYGDSVDIKKIKLLTKKLITTNNNFKLIKNFKSNTKSDWKMKTIEIKFEKNLDTLPTIKNNQDIEKWFIKK